MSMRGGTKGKSGIRSVTTILVALSLMGALASPGRAYTRPGRTVLVSRTAVVPDPSVVEGAKFSSVSATGRYVAFDNLSPLLVIPDTNLLRDVFVYDSKLDRMELASVSSEGIQGVGESTRPSITPNGRYVAFLSEASNLVEGDTNLVADVFVRDLRRGLTERVSVASDGSEASLGATINASGTPAHVSISADGRLVSFVSRSPDLTAGDTNGVNDVFLHDRKNHRTTIVSVPRDGGEANDQSTCTSISADGHHVAFTSSASNLVGEDTNNARDAFIRDLRSGKNELISVASDGSQAQLLGGATCGVDGRTLSTDGRYVVFGSGSANLVPNDSNFGGLDSDVFIRDRKTRRTELISVTSYGEEPSGASGFGLSLSADGRYATFTSDANDLFCCDTGSATEPLPLSGDYDVFIHDLHDGSTEPVSIGHDGSEATGCDGGLFSADSSDASVSYNGRFVSFVSCAANLEPEDSSGRDYDVYLRDRGIPLGIGGLDRSGNSDSEPNDQICIQPDLCIPPGAAVSSSDSTNDLNEVLTEQGANLYGASLAYRPQNEDLFAAIELEHMPQVLPGISPLFYGLQFRVEERNYEARVTSILGGTFGLFDCTGSRPACTQVADLRGGYGTTGMRVVFSLPLNEIRLENGGRLKNVMAFSGLGSYLTGATKVLDRVSIK